MKHLAKTKVFSCLASQRQTLILFLTAGCLIFLCLYGYFLASSFRHAYEREANVELLNTLRADVATLETEYNLAVVNSLTFEVALARGFHDVTPTLAYVEKKGDGFSKELALRINP